MSTRGISTDKAPNWRADAACHGTGDVMFPDPTDAKANEEAKRYCAGCPVIEACLAEALAEEGGKSPAYRYGIRGGLNPAERRGRYRSTLTARPVEARRRVSRKPVPPCGTPAGYDRHKRRGESVDDACREAHNAQKRERHAKAKADAACGTRRGYRRHHREGTPPCDACRKANADARRQYRNFGSHVAA